MPLSVLDNELQFIKLPNEGHETCVMTYHGKVLRADEACRCTGIGGAMLSAPGSIFFSQRPMAVGALDQIDVARG